MNKEISSREVFPRKLKYYCDLTGKTRKEICAALDFKYPTFCDWCQGKKYPRVDKIDMLAQYFSTMLGVEVRYSDLTEDKKEQPAAESDGLSDELKELIERLKELPEDKVQMLLQVARSIK